MVRVVIADASAAARRLLADMLTLDPAFTVVGEANDGPTAVAVTRRLRPDVVLMDVDIAGSSDFAATKQIMIEIPTPIMVVQHMASGFIDGFAKWLDTGCALRVKVAEHGEPLVGHTVFIAPDNRQLGLSSEGNVELSNQAPVDGFRPSATYLFRSVARLASSSAIAVMLTGMGRDGVEGLREIRSGGGLVLVQDEQSSVVFGMPAAAISAGCADHVLPLAAMAPRLMETIG